MYSIGIDYGTESGRVLILNLANGEEMATVVVPYRHGVIDDVLPETGEPLPPDWALQDPDDYIHVLTEGIPAALAKAGIRGEEVIGIGIDFTSCTVLPVTRDGIPLCALPEWRRNKHAWVKLWKHHAAQRIADRINEVAAARGETFLSRYGGRISSEWYFPKLLEVFEEAPEVYAACDRFIEATDFIVWFLTGREVRNSCTAGYKAMWSEEEGLPSDDFFRALHPSFTQPAEKLGTTFYPLGTRAGYLRPDVADMLGLTTRVAVAVGNVDAHVSVPGCGVSEPGTLVMVMGTSICHLTVTKEEIRLPGITGVVKDGILPGWYGYEAGQAAVGDMFAWFVQHAVPGDYFAAAEKAHLNIYEHLERLAARFAPGETGLVALDWWNGNRSILGDADLTGVIAGLTLASTPEAVYRALLESTAFGTRRIVENFQAHGVAIRDLAACGGIAHKSPLLMQIYADVCGLPVTVRASSEIPARGAAMFGAVAAGPEAGGFRTIQEASAALAPPVLRVYQPNGAAKSVYDRVYAIYKDLYEMLGQSRVDLLHALKRIRLDVTGSQRI
ncbi:ribulokinase [Alicyclobacillus cellulosilyticus]|uniref:Ribulokinase n=1 Tax=Alicyclobacillus cellulosilyticus TaxID=1003997 RepID=A0A917NI16_9BACL|nr:ribulokinase [Alicyclobacillus cellulosilyticus]GGJ02074.1 ribulokinase [Alicyclobacillus cellulosilyticus]